MLRGGAHEGGFSRHGRQIIDASIVAAPKQRNTEGEKAEIKAGRIPQAWKDRPAKLAQKDRDARWTVKFSKAKPSDDARGALISRCWPLATRTTLASTAAMA